MRLPGDCAAHAWRPQGRAVSLSVDIWRLWIREYGAAGAIELALRSGYSRAEILRVNREARDLALQGAEL